MLEKGGSMGGTPRSKAFNQLEATDIPKAVTPLLRLTRLQLNDNPLAWGPAHLRRKDICYRW